MNKKFLCILCLGVVVGVSNLSAGSYLSKAKNLASSAASAATSALAYAKSFDERTKREVLDFYQSNTDLFKDGKNDSRITAFKNKVVKQVAKENLDEILGILDELNASDIDGSVISDNNGFVEAAFEKLKSLQPKLITNLDLKTFLENSDFKKRSYYSEYDKDEQKNVYLKMLKLCIKLINKTLLGESIAEADFKVDGKAYYSYLYDNSKKK